MEASPSKSAKRRRRPKSRMLKSHPLTYKAARLRHRRKKPKKSRSRQPVLPRGVSSFTAESKSASPQPKSLDFIHSPRSSSPHLGHLSSSSTSSASSFFLSSPSTPAHCRTRPGFSSCRQRQRRRFRCVLFEDLPTPLHLLCFSFLSARDAAVCMQLSCRTHLLLEEARRCSPQLVAAASTGSEPTTTCAYAAVVDVAVNKLSVHPNLAFVMTTDPGSCPVQSIRKRLPPDTSILVGMAVSVQSNIEGNVLHADVPMSATAEEAPSGEGEHTTKPAEIAVLLGAFPEATMVPFNVSDMHDYTHDDHQHHHHHHHDHLHHHHDHEHTHAHSDLFSPGRDHDDSSHHRNPPDHDHEHDHGGEGTREEDAGDREGGRRVCCVSGVEGIQSRLRLARPDADSSFWKVFVVLVAESGQAAAEETLQALQRLYPQAAIIGGQCRMALVKQGEDFVGHTRGVAGLALGGNVPLRTCVSLGLRAAGDSPFVISHATPPGAPGGSHFISSVARPGSAMPGCLAGTQPDPHNNNNNNNNNNNEATTSNTNPRRLPPSSLSPPPQPPATTTPPVPVPLALSLPLSSGESESEEEDTAQTRQPLSREESAHGEHDEQVQPPHRGAQPDGSVLRWLGSALLGLDRTQPAFLGIKRPGDPGYALFNANNWCVFGETLLLEDEDARCVEGAQIQLFGFDGEACITDLDSMLSRLAKAVDDKQEELIGAVMFSCLGRGPHGRMLPERVMDASHFNTAFPGLPLVGFYAGGEIGPQARAEVESGAFQTGKVAFQGFTVVFGVFIKPKRQAQVSELLGELDAATARAIFHRAKGNGAASLASAFDNLPD